MKINSWQEKSAHTDLSLQCVAGHCCSSFALVSFRLLSKVTQRFSIQTQWKRYFLPFLFFHRFCLFWLRFFSKTPLIVQVQNSRHIMAEIVPTNSLEAWMNFGRFFVAAWCWCYWKQTIIVKWLWIWVVTDDMSVWVYAGCATDTAHRLCQTEWRCLCQNIRQPKELMKTQKHSTYFSSAQALKCTRTHNIDKHSVFSPSFHCTQLKFFPSITNRQ